MATTTVLAFTDATSCSAGDKVYLIVDPGGTPLDRDIELGNLFKRGTLTTDVKVLDLAATWNNGGVTFTGIKANFTDTASAAGSLFIDLQVNGASKATITKAGQHIVAVGSASGPSYSFLAYTNMGMYTSDGVLRFAVGGNLEFSVTDDAIHLGGVNDMHLYRDAAYIFALRNSANAHTSRVYGDYAGATDYQRNALTTSRTVNSSVSGATVTMSSLIPAGAFLLGVTTRIDAALGTSNGTTGYNVGDGSDADLWGVVTGTTIGTSSASSDFTAAGASSFSTTARDVVLTATGGNFDGTGDITVCAHYFITEAD